MNAPGALTESNTWDGKQIKLENFPQKTDVSGNCEVGEWISLSGAYFPDILCEKVLLNIIAAGYENLSKDPFPCW